MLGYSATQSRALALMPKLTGTMSLLASAFISHHVLQSPSKRRRPYHRLLLGMSVNDIIGSFFAYVLSTTPMPAGSTYGAKGSMEFCSAAGFFNQGGNLAAPLYNASLATFYLLTIVYGWKENYIATKIEPYFHAVPLIIGWGTASAAAAMDLYAPANWTCWIAPYPEGCQSTWRYGIEEANCERGNDAFLYRFVFMYGLIWITVVYVIVVMVLIYRFVLSAERATAKYCYTLSTPAPSNSHPGENQNRIFRSNSQLGDSQSRLNPTSSTCEEDGEDGERKQQQRHRIRQKKRYEKSKRIAYQALLYVGALMLTFFFGTIVRIVQLSHLTAGFGLIFMMTIFNPLQGFFNMMIYLRPRYVNFCNENKDVPWLQNLQKFILVTFVCKRIRQKFNLDFLKRASCFYDSHNDDDEKKGDESNIERDNNSTDQNQDTRGGTSKTKTSPFRRSTADLDFPRLSSRWLSCSELGQSIRDQSDRSVSSGAAASRNHSLLSMVGSTRFGSFSLRSDSIVSSSVLHRQMDKSQEIVMSSNHTSGGTVLNAPLIFVHGGESDSENDEELSIGDSSTFQASKSVFRTTGSSEPHRSSTNDFHPSSSIPSLLPPLSQTFSGEGGTIMLTMTKSDEDCAIDARKNEESNT